MSKVVSRLLTFFIGIPVVLGLVFLSYFNHLALNIAICIASGIAAYEFAGMFSTEEKSLFPKPVLIILCIIQPLICYIISLLNYYFVSVIDLNITAWVLLAEIIILMAWESLSAKTFENSVYKISLSVLCLFYCGYMLTFLTRLTTLENILVGDKTYPASVIFISLYFVLVFLCDSAAWLFGVLWGKSTRGYIAASPNKSIVGFLGGIAASVAFGILFWLLFPQVLWGGIWKIILVSLLSAFTSIIGDLIESVFKRSCGVKDSGSVIPGRGGLLDSIDSLILTIPVYYVLIHFLYL